MLQVCTVFITFYTLFELSVIKVTGSDYQYAPAFGLYQLIRGKFMKYELIAGDYRNFGNWKPQSYVLRRTKRDKYLLRLTQTQNTLIRELSSLLEDI